MSNRGSLTKITSDVILDDTIINADIKPTANITRSKMNETQDVLIKTGAKLQVNEVANVKNVQISHDGTNAIITVSSGDMVLTALSGIMQLLKAGVNGTLKIFGSGGVNRLDVGHNNTNGYITAQKGDLNLSAELNVLSYQDLIVKVAKNLIVQDAAGTKDIRLYHNGNFGYLATPVGIIIIATETGLTEFYKSGVNSTIKVYGSGGLNAVQIWHDNTDGRIYSTAGNLVLSPAGVIRCNNKIVDEIQDLQYNAAIIRYLTITGITFQGNDGGVAAGSDNVFHEINSALEYNGVVQQVFTRGICLPHEAIITALRMPYYQLSAASVIQLYLYRTNMLNTVVEVCHCTDGDVVASWANADSGAIANNTVDNTQYAYYLTAYMTNNAAQGDVKLGGARISYTVQKPLP